MAAQRVNMVGRKCGRLLVVSFSHNRERVAYWTCVCDCGNRAVAKGAYLRSGVTTSCGCYGKHHALKHGLYGTPEYKTWHNMWQRCSNPNNLGYTNYGGRGIAVCPEWKDFARFYADVGPRPPGLTLDRRNNNEGYNKDNCRWATRLEQNSNRRNTRLITFNGETKSMDEWSRGLEMSRKSVRCRIAAGWSIEDAVTKPSQKGKPYPRNNRPRVDAFGNATAVPVWRNNRRKSSDSIHHTESICGSYEEAA